MATAPRAAPMVDPERDSQMGTDAERDELLVRCLALQEDGAPSRVEELLALHPRHADVVRRRLRLLHESGLLDARAGDSAIPERLGEFRLLERIGGGGMGVVYLAEQGELGRRVALKLIRPESLYFPGARERFAQEARSVARLSHPGIVQVHTVGEEAGIPYIAMEFVDGLPLSDALSELRQRGSRELAGADLRSVLAARADPSVARGDGGGLGLDRDWADTCAWIGRELAQALEHAHQRGVVHRDLKPSNVMLTVTGRVLLVDFGLARVSGVDQLTRSGAALGSLPYMAPEQVQGRTGDVGPWTDVYGLGVTLYELLSLRRAYPHDDETRLRAAILAGDCPRVSRLAQRVQRDLEVVVATAMSPELRRRYRSAADLARDLTHVLAREPIEARPAGTLERSLSWARRNPVRALAGGLAAVIVIGGPLGFGVVQSRAAETERRLADSLETARDLAERRNDELSTANDELERKRSDLVQALESEASQRRWAVRNFAHALDAVDTMLTRVGFERLQDVPQMEGLRRELLEDALGFYERFVGERGRDPAVRFRSAVTQRKVSLIREELGELVAARSTADDSVATMRALESEGCAIEDLPQALAAALAQQATVLLALQELELAESVQRELLARLEQLTHDPAHAAYAIRQRSVTHQHLAILLRDTGRVDEAIEHARSGLELLEGNSDLSAEDADALQEVGISSLSLAIMSSQSAPPREGEAAISRSLALVRRASELAPRDPRKRESLASALGNLGLFLSRRQFDQGYSPAGEDAESALRASVDIYVDLVERFPLRALYRSGLASASSNLCVHLARSGRWQDARTFAELARDSSARLVELAPESADHRSQLGAALNNLAGLDLFDGQAERALEGLDLAEEEMALAQRLEPMNAQFAGQFRHSRIARVQALLALQRWPAALDELRRFERDNTDLDARTWSLEQRCACISMALAAAGPGGSTLADVDTARAETVELLRGLVAAGQDGPTLAKLPAVAALHGHEGFEAWLREVGGSR